MTAAPTSGRAGAAGVCRGAGSERAALLALAAGRLLVPLVATLTEPDSENASGDVPDGENQGREDPAATAGQQHAGGEKGSEMALPTLVGRDGRLAIPAFTGLAALARWDPAARPVPASAAQVWQAAVADDCAVVIDVAGPVPLAVEGARLAALAAGAVPPLPHEDPDIRAEVAALLAGPAAAAGLTGAQVAFMFGPADDEADLLIELTVPAALGGAAAQRYAAGVGEAVAAELGPRLRRGIAIALAVRPGLS